jgi:MFS family permease
MVAPARHRSTHPMVAILRTPALVRALLAFFAFGMAEWATYIAILVWAFERGGASAAGWIAVVQLVPATLAAPFASVLGDRMRRDRALGVGYGVQAVAFLATAASLLLDAPEAIVYVTAAAAATAIVLTRPVHNAIVPEIAETPAQLTAGNAASSTVEGIAIFAGPLLTGVILALAGPGWVFALFGLTGIGASLLTWSLPLKRTFDRVIDPESAVKATLAGLRTLRHETGALLLTIVVGAQFVVVGLLDILTVVLGLDVLDMGPSGPGLLTSALGVGGLLGAAATVVLVGRRRLAPAVAVGMLVTGIPLVAIALVTLPLVAWLLLALAGVGKAFVDVSGRTLLQRSVESGVLSRIFGVQESLLMGGTAIGSAVAPLFINNLGARGAFVATGVVLPAVGLLAWTQIRKLDATALQPGPGFSLLEGIPMFALLPTRVLEKLSRDLVPMSFSHGTDVVSEGNVGDRIYLVASGQVDIIKRGESIAVMRAGDFFGEIALLRDIPRTATARAMGDVELYALERDVFLEAVTGSSAARELADTVADRRLRHSGDA